MANDTKTPTNYAGTVKSHNAFLNWIQEYSKIITTVTFIIFVIIHIYLLVMFTIEYFSSGNMEDMTTLLTETHTTFRDVIGGYIIKAACENAIKISGTIISRYIDAKYPPSNAEENVGGEYTESDEIY